MSESANIKLIPYCEIDGVFNFPDSWIKSLFARMREERLLHKAFSEGEIQTADEFLKAMKYGGNRLFIVIKDDPEKEVLGFTWLNGFRARSAFMHICLFRNAWGKESPDVGKAVLYQLLHLSDAKGYVFDVLIGITPANNKLAVKWIKKIGMAAGIIPNGAWDSKLGKSVPAFISYGRREEG